LGAANGTKASEAVGIIKMNAQVGRKRERTEGAGNDGCEIELWGFRGRDEDVRVARLGCDEGEDVAHSAAKLF
jgi:hypothetical protein